MNQSICKSNSKVNDGSIRKKNKHKVPLYNASFGSTNEEKEQEKEDQIEENRGTKNDKEDNNESFKCEAIGKKRSSKKNENGKKTIKSKIAIVFQFLYDQVNLPLSFYIGISIGILIIVLLVIIFYNLSEKKDSQGLDKTQNSI